MKKSLLLSVCLSAICMTGIAHSAPVGPCELPDSHPNDPTNTDSTVVYTNRHIVVVGQIDGHCCIDGKDETMDTIPYTEAHQTAKVQSKQYSLTLATIFKRLTWYITPGTGGAVAGGGGSTTQTDTKTWGPSTSEKISAAPRTSKLKYFIHQTRVETEVKDVGNTKNVTKVQSAEELSGPYEGRWDSDEDFGCPSLEAVPAGKDRCADEPTPTTPTTPTNPPIQAGPAA